jgi:hypothetical protein
MASRKRNAEEAMVDDDDDSIGSISDSDPNDSDEFKDPESSGKSNLKHVHSRKHTRYHMNFSVGMISSILSEFR